MSKPLKSIHIGPGNAVVHVTSADTIIWGGTGADTIYGGSGNDTIFAGTGPDTIYGGSGNDLIETSNAKNGVVIHAGTGNETIEGTSREYVYLGNSSHVEVSLPANLPHQDPHLYLWDFGRAAGDKLLVSLARFGIVDFNIASATAGKVLVDGLVRITYGGPADVNGMHHITGIALDPGGFITTQAANVAATAHHAEFIFQDNPGGQALYFDSDGSGPAAPEMIAGFMTTTHLHASDFIFTAI